MTDTTTTTEQGQGSADQTQSQSSTEAKGGKGGDKAAGAAAAVVAGAEAGAGADGGETAWYAGLPDDLKAEKSILRHANLEDAIRAGLGAEKRLGVPADQLVRLPSKPEEFADLYRKLGAPETAEGYQIGLPDQATDADKALAERFGKHMFEAGPFPPAFVKAAVDFINGETLAGMEAETAATTERNAAGEALLKKELGQKFDPEMKAVGKLLNDLGGPELAEELNASGFGANPQLMLMLHKVVERLGESQGVEGQGTGTGASGGLTPGQAKAARLNLENDPVKGAALRDASHSMHNSVLEERRRLLEAENA